MVGYPLNFRSNNIVHESNHGRSQRPQLQPQPPMIACRFCDHLFMNTRALINHVESHMKEDGTDRMTSTLMGQPPIIPRTHQSCYPNYHHNTLPMAAMSVSPSLSPSGYGSLMHQELHQSVLRPRPISGLQTQHAVVEEPYSDGTRLFIQQLERPFVGTSALEESGSRSSSIEVDLALKLSLSL
ncbi:hypothetical protein HS088_TW01G00308 [Tripterygium wilfordii]|uniref:C2H2-type domain-containing protein n=1 Tax=Tripterygium wilfordii TaxID=458696 RepID=A0A7J7E1I4_TRIWF|nr:hypothetical protein HS088_TW01G00308 [Tripterygium wilfordii]